MPKGDYNIPKHHSMSFEFSPIVVQKNSFFFLVVHEQFVKLD
jgi:hypothetical protein